MSADNWAICPRCKLRHEKFIAGQKAAAASHYGQVSAEEYAEMADHIARIDKPHTDLSFREDYEIYGADDGVLTVSYHGQCSACGLSLTVKSEHPIEGVDL